MKNAYSRGDGPGVGRYQLRHAAGLYWLIDLEQPGGAYVNPIPLNDSGARLWRLIDSGASQEEICRRLCEEYGISAEQAQSDVREFIEQLQSMRVDLGGT